MIDIWWILVDKKLNRTQESAEAAQKPTMPGQVEGGDSAPLLCSGETPPELCPDLGFPM